jgi:periplasmic divalent cation tolerance protein
MQTTCTSIPVTVVMVYATCPDLDVARRIGRAVVEEGLAACANCIPGMTSIYRWEGAIQESAEVVLICKTTISQAVTVRHRLAQLHPYTIPCIVELSTVAVHPDFAAWISSQVTRG